MINEQFCVKEFHIKKKRILFDELRIAIILLWKERWQLQLRKAYTTALTYHFLVKTSVFVTLLLYFSFLLFSCFNE